MCDPFDCTGQSITPVAWLQFIIWDPYFVENEDDFVTSHLDSSSYTIRFGRVWKFDVSTCTCHLMKNAGLKAHQESFSIDLSKVPTNLFSFHICIGWSCADVGIGGSVSKTTTYFQTGRLNVKNSYRMRANLMQVQNFQISGH